MTALVTDLTGLGTPTTVATFLGEDVRAVTGSGTAQVADGAAIAAGSALCLGFNTVTTTGGATAVQILSTMPVGRSLFVNVTSATTALVYPPSGCSIQGQATDTPILAAQNSPILLFRNSRTTFIGLTAVTSTGGTGTLTSLAAGAGITLTPDPVTVAGTVAVTDTAITPATYGDATHVAQVTFNSRGQATSASSVVISGVPLASIADLRLLANISGGSAAPSANTLTAIIDAIIGSTQGQILYRDALAWTALAVGTAGQFLQTGGAGANPAWATVSSPIITVSDAVSAAGTTLGGATALTTEANTITTCAAGAGTKFQAAASDPIGTKRFVKNTTANNLKQYPDSGSAIDGLGTDVADVIFPDQARVYVRMGATQWRVFSQA